MSEPSVKRENLEPNLHPQYDQEEVQIINGKLARQLEPTEISHRTAFGGSRVAYLEGWKSIEIANEIFGFNGWSSEIKDFVVDFLDVADGKWSVGVTAHIRVITRDGSFHEDVGYGTMENAKSKGQAFEKARKEAVTDGVKRALRYFGNALGNCLYDKKFLASAKKPPTIINNPVNSSNTSLGNGTYSNQNINTNHNKRSFPNQALNSNNIRMGIESNSNNINITSSNHPNNTNNTINLASSTNNQINNNNNSINHNNIRNFNSINPNQGMANLDLNNTTRSYNASNLNQGKVNPSSNNTTRNPNPSNPSRGITNANSNNNKSLNPNNSNQRTANSNSNSNMSFTQGGSNNSSSTTFQSFDVLSQDTSFDVPDFLLRATDSVNRIDPREIEIKKETMANGMNVDHHSEQFNFNAFANNIHSINSMKIDKPNNSSPSKRNHRPNDLNQKRFRDN